MKTMLVAFFLAAAARLSAQDGLPYQTIPEKTGEPHSYPEGFAMGVLVSEAKPSKEDVDIFSKLVSAIEKKDFQSFVADGEPAFKALPEEKFTSFASQLAPKLNGDHDVTYLGALIQKGYRVTLWKVRFKDGDDDMLATLSVRNGKIGGFYNWWLALQRRPLAYRAVLTIATMGSAILAYSCLSSDSLTMRGGHILTDGTPTGGAPVAPPSRATGL